MLTHDVASIKEAVIYFNASLLGDGVMVTMLLQIALLFLTVCIDPYILKKQKRIIMAIIALIVTLIVSEVFTTWLEDQPERMPARTFLSIYNYSVWPLILLLFCHIFTDKISIVFLILFHRLNKIRAYFPDFFSHFVRQSLVIRYEII